MYIYICISSRPRGELLKFQADISSSREAPISFAGDCVRWVPKFGTAAVIHFGRFIHSEWSGRGGDSDREAALVSKQSAVPPLTLLFVCLLVFNVYPFQQFLHRGLRRSNDVKWNAWRNWGERDVLSSLWRLSERGLWEDLTRLYCNEGFDW